jgi:hypothetical protein
VNFITDNEVYSHVVRPILRQLSSALSHLMKYTMRILGYGRRCCGNVPKILSGYLTNTRQPAENLISVPHEHQATCRKSNLGTSRTPRNLPKILSGYLTNIRQPAPSVEDTLLSLTIKILKVQCESSYLLES